MDKEVRRTVEELQITHKCLIILTFAKETKMKVFYDDGRISDEVVIGNSTDYKETILINMRRFFKQG